MFDVCRSDWLCMKKKKEKGGVKNLMLQKYMSLELNERLVQQVEGKGGSYHPPSPDVPNIIC